MSALNAVLMAFLTAIGIIIAAALLETIVECRKNGEKVYEKRGEKVYNTKTIGVIVSVLGSVILIAGIVGIVQVAQSGFGDELANFTLELGNELGIQEFMTFGERINYFVITNRVAFTVLGSITTVIGFLITIWNRKNIDIHINITSNKSE